MIGINKCTGYFLEMPIFLFMFMIEPIGRALIRSRIGCKRLQTLGRRMIPLKNIWLALKLTWMNKYHLKKLFILLNKISLINILKPHLVKAREWRRYSNVLPSIYLISISLNLEMVQELNLSLLRGGLTQRV